MTWLRLRSLFWETPSDLSIAAMAYDACGGVSKYNNLAAVMIRLRPFLVSCPLPASLIF